VHLVFVPLNRVERLFDTGGLEAFHLEVANYQQWGQSTATVPEFTGSVYILRNIAEDVDHVSFIKKLLDHSTGRSMLVAKQRYWLHA
jgi:hypothetical protein